MPLLYSFMLRMKLSTSLLEASLTADSRETKTGRYMMFVFICTNTSTHARNSLRWSMTFFSSDAESEEEITDVHQYFLVHCVTNCWPHNMIRLNSTRAVLQGRSIESPSQNIPFKVLEGGRVFVGKEAAQRLVKLDFSKLQT